MRNRSVFTSTFKLRMTVQFVLFLLILFRKFSFFRINYIFISLYNLVKNVSSYADEITSENITADVSMEVQDYHILECGQLEIINVLVLECLPYTTTVYPTELTTQTTVYPMEVTTQIAVYTTELTAQAVVYPTELTTETTVYPMKLTTEITIYPTEDTLQTTDYPTEVTTKTAVSRTELTTQTTVYAMELTTKTIDYPIEYIIQITDHPMEVTTQTTVYPVEVTTQTTVHPVELTTMKKVLPPYVCENGNLGPSCDIPSDSCVMAKPCQNQGICYPNDTFPSRYYCQCSPGYSGDNCENENGICKHNTCW